MNQLSRPTNNHLIVNFNDSLSRCEKCNQHCDISLEHFRKNIVPGAGDVGHCVAINDREMVLVSCKTGDIKETWYCRISDEEYYIKAILL